jgi:acetolactate synthase I/II/III large subunit
MAGGSMGFGPAGSIGAAMGLPEARTICWTGDGGMSMATPAWLTVAEYGLPITFVVINDQGYGAVANIQKAHYGSTIFSEFDAGGTRSAPLEFNAAEVAAASGIPSRLIEDPREVTDGLQWAHRSEGPTVLDIRCDQGSVVPPGGGSYLHDFWNHRTLPPVGR